MHIRAQLVIPWDSGNSEDVTVHTTYWDTVSGGYTATIGQEIVDRFEAWWTQLNAYFTTIFDHTNVQLKLYNHNDPTPQTPLATLALTVPAPTAGGALPCEVAMCMSYRAAFSSGVNPARRRGRLFLGPIGVGATDTTQGAGAPRPLAAFMAKVTDAGLALATPVIAGPNIVQWVQYSPTANAFNPVIEVWCNNEWDTMRSRGVRATTRDTSGVFAQTPPA